MECSDPERGPCRELCDRLSEYIDGELDSERRRAIEAHLAGCPACRACAAALRQTIALCGCCGAEPAPEGFSRRLRAFLRAHLEPPGPSPDPGTARR
jgi:anti-sigma factor (TIGR02949 family)